MRAWTLLAWVVIGCSSAPTSDAGQSPDGGDRDARVRLCAADTDCATPDFCDGEERCLPGDPAAGANGCVPGSAPCQAPLICNEALDRCDADDCTEPDRDNDGDRRIACGGSDCDDDDRDRSGRAIEICDPDGVDEDCNPSTFRGATDGDVDGDGYISRVCRNTRADGSVVSGDDCDDGNLNVHPGVTELCNGVDDDCDPGIVGPGEDDDGDGYLDADCGGDDCYDDAAMAGPGSCDITAVVAGEHHNCALRASGRVVCWGYNDYGQVGMAMAPGELPIVRVPTEVSLPGAASAVAASDSSTCAIVDRTTVYCWGNNQDGQLGDGGRNGDRNPGPRLVLGVVGEVSLLAGGARHFCLSASDATRCWGGNQYGQLGLGSTGASVPIPMAVRNIASSSALAAGFHSCAVASGQLYCWGPNDVGQLGLGMASATPTTTPALLSSFSAAELGSGAAHACAVQPAGTVACWGWNDRGQLGDGTTLNRAAPTAVRGLRDAARIRSRHRHTCAVRTDGTVACWGQNNIGQLGNGLVVDSSVPVDVELTAVVDIAVGELHTCALRATGQVVCWGRNGEGQLGTVGSGESHVPLPITPPAP